MVKEQGIVEKVEDRRAMIRVNRTSACATCTSRGSCQMEKRDVVVEVANDLQAKVGDQVELSLPEGAVMKLSIIVYLLPIIALIIGAFTGASIGNALLLNASVSALAGGATLMILVFFFLKRLEKNPDFRQRYQARLTRIISASSPFPDDSR